MDDCIFKIGDRVRIIETGYSDMAKLGAIGTVIENGTAPWICFDEITGRSGGCKLPGGKPGHMDCIPEDRLELVEQSESSDPVTTRCDIECIDAPAILERAAAHIRDRAEHRDQLDGERSMGRTVAAFNALTGHELSERDGWMFMLVLKQARATNTPFGLADDYEDMTAYSALMGECAEVMRAKGCIND